MAQASMACTSHVAYAADVFTVLLCICGIDCILKVPVCTHSSERMLITAPSLGLWESCGCLQDEHNGGISDRPEDMVDAFHTFFGIAALSLMGYKGLELIDPVYALPVKVMQQIRQHQKK